LCVGLLLNESSEVFGDLVQCAGMQGQLHRTRQLATTVCRHNDKQLCCAAVLAGLYSVTPNRNGQATSPPADNPYAKHEGSQHKVKLLTTRVGAALTVDYPPELAAEVRFLPFFMHLGVLSCWLVTCLGAAT
jgi:hypothetical protein